MHYHRLIALVVLVNGALLARHLARGDWHVADGSALSGLADLIVVNFAIAVLIPDVRLRTGHSTSATTAPLTARSNPPMRRPGAQPESPASRSLSPMSVLLSYHASTSCEMIYLPRRISPWSSRATDGWAQAGGLPLRILRQSFPGLSRAPGGMRPWMAPAHEGVICLWVPSPSCTPGAPTAAATATQPGAHGGGSTATRAAPARSAREAARSRFRRVAACRPVGCVRRLVHHHVGPAPPGPAPRQAAPPGPVRMAAVAVAAGPDRDGGGGDDGGGAVAVADRTDRDGAGPPWRRRHRSCGHWRAARRPGPATACHPAAAARQNAGAAYCQPVPGCRYPRRGWRYTCARRYYPGGTRALYAGRPG